MLSLTNGAARLSSFDKTININLLLTDMAASPIFKSSLRYHGFLSPVLFPSNHHFIARAEVWLRLSFEEAKSSVPAAQSER